MYDHTALTDRVVYPLGYLPSFGSKRYFFRPLYCLNMSQLEFTSVAYPEKSKGRFNINKKCVVMNNILIYGCCFTTFI